MKEEGEEEEEEGVVVVVGIREGEGARKERGEGKVYGDICCLMKWIDDSGFCESSGVMIWFE